MELNHETLAKFAKKFKDGQIVFSEYEPGVTFYLIQSGSVELLKLDGDTEKTIAILKPPEMFGEMAILDTSPRSATAIARGESVLVEFNKNNFLNLMETMPQLALKLLKSFITRMYESKNRYIMLKNQYPSERIAQVFVDMDAALPASGKTDDQRTFNTSVENIARLAGMTENQTREALLKFAEEKRIAFGGRNCIIVLKMSWFINYLKNVSSS